MNHPRLLTLAGLATALPASVLMLGSLSAPGPDLSIDRQLAPIAGGTTDGIVLMAALSDDGSDDDDFSSGDNSDGDPVSDDEDGSSDDVSDGDGASDDEDGSSDDQSEVPGEDGSDDDDFSSGDNSDGDAASDDGDGSSDDFSDGDDASDDEDGSSDDNSDLDEVSDDDDASSDDPSDSPPGGGDEISDDDDASSDDDSEDDNGDGDSSEGVDDDGSEDAPLHSAAVAQGTPAGGNLAAVDASDNNYMVVASGRAGSRQRAAVTVRATSPITRVSRLDVLVEAGSSLAGAETALFVWNDMRGAWKSFSVSPQTVEDSIVQFSITNKPGQYVNKQTGQVRVKVQVQRAGQAAFQALIDHVEVTAVP
jgi:hypothetical protein